VNSDEPDDRDNNRPTIEVTNGANGRMTASAVLDSRISISHLRDAKSITSIAEGEFLDVEEELKIVLGDNERARDRNIRVSSVSFRGDHEQDVVVQSTLLIELTQCDATDPRCSDVIGLIINDAVGELRKALAGDLAQYIGGQ
jgi:hypothetical protein